MSCAPAIEVCGTSANRAPARRRFGWRSRLLMLCLSAVATFALAEGAVRLLDIDGRRQDIGMVPHPRWHHWHQPDHSFLYQVPGENISLPERYNSLGMRDSREIEVAKPRGVLRVAVLGDSFVEALQVPESDGVVPRLEAQLKSASGARVEVLNFGCSGFSSALELILLRDWVRSFEPDLVVCLHHFSDMTEDWKFTERAEYAAGRLETVPGRSSKFERWLHRGLETSQLYRATRSAVGNMQRSPAPSADASLKQTFDAVVHEPYTSADEQAWERSLGAVAEMAELMRGDNVPFLVVIVPIGTQIEPVTPDYAARLGYRYLADGHRLEQCGYQRKVADFCKARDIACLDLLEAFRAANPSGASRLYLPRDQHWTAAGHEQAARHIAAELRQRGWVGRP